METNNPSDAGNTESVFGEPIYTYTRREAVIDGFQVSVPAETSVEAGFKFPVYLNRTVWE